MAAVSNMDPKQKKIAGGFVAGFVLVLIAYFAWPSDYPVQQNQAMVTQMGVSMSRHALPYQWRFHQSSSSSICSQKNE